MNWVFVFLCQRKEFVIKIVKSPSPFTPFLQKCKMVMAAYSLFILILFKSSCWGGKNEITANLLEYMNNLLADTLHVTNIFWNSTIRMKSSDKFYKWTWRPQYVIFMSKVYDIYIKGKQWCAFQSLVCFFTKWTFLQVMTRKNNGFNNWCRVLSFFYVITTYVIKYSFDM